MTIGLVVNRESAVDQFYEMGWPDRAIHISGHCARIDTERAASEILANLHRELSANFRRGQIQRCCQTADEWAQADHGSFHSDFSAMIDPSQMWAAVSDLTHNRIVGWQAIQNRA